MSIARPLLRLSTYRCLPSPAKTPHRLSTVQKHLKQRTQVCFSTRTNILALPSTSESRKTETSDTENMAPKKQNQNGGEQQVAGEEHSEGKNDWKKRAPYKVHDSDKGFDVKYEANCHCGRVKYQLSRDAPLDSKLCHCTTCQTQHAAPFQWAAIFHKEDINFTHGHHDLEWYDPSSKSIEHKLPCKVRCSFCHSPIMDEGRNMILLFPTLIHLKDDEARAKFKPKLHMFYGQRVIDIPDGLPKWDGLNEGPDSKLIADSPPDLVREVERKKVEEKKENSKKRKNN